MFIHLKIGTLPDYPKHIAHNAIHFLLSALLSISLPASIAVAWSSVLARCDLVS
jgi:hypothetical protein